MRWQCGWRSWDFGLLNFLRRWKMAIRKQSKRLALAAVEAAVDEVERLRDSESVPAAERREAARIAVEGRTVLYLAGRGADTVARFLRARVAEQKATERRRQANIRAAIG